MSETDRLLDDWQTLPPLSSKEQKALDNVDETAFLGNSSTQRQAAFRAWRKANIDRKTYRRALESIIAVSGCECDDYHGHKCLMCRVRGMASEGLDSTWTLEKVREMSNDNTSRREPIKRDLNVAVKTTDPVPCADEHDTVTDHFIDWMLSRVAEMDHGCLTGDCPHVARSECIHDIRRCYEGNL
uniref:Uncharacterized protein n=1 Tax=viral metagenome TaxID=1070528 RepID=A0A6M3LB67_9ZZZZ